MKKKSPYVLLCEKMKAKNAYIKRLKDALEAIANSTGGLMDTDRMRAEDADCMNHIAQDTLAEDEP